MRLIYQISTILLISLISITVSAQDGNVIKLNSIESAINNFPEKTKANQERTYFVLETGAFEQDIIHKGSILQLELSNERVTELEIVRKSEFVPGTISYLAKKSGNDEIFAFTYSDGKINGIYHQIGEEDFHFGVEDGVGFIAKKKNAVSEKELSCGLDGDHNNHEHSRFDTAKAKLSQAREVHIPNTMAMATSVQDSITIDLMFAYTAKAKTWSESSQFGTIEAVIAQSMNLSQSALDNSETAIKLRLVHFYQTNYTDDGTATTAGTHLRRLTQNESNPSFAEEFSGYMTEVHGLRNQYGADLVGLLASEPNTGGIAWLLNNTTGSANRGFSVNRVQQVATGYTLVHEIGHNMGNNHSRTQTDANAGGSGGLFHYSVGFQNTPNNFATIMAYAEPGMTRAPYFSSPDYMVSGGPAGNSAGQNPSDNARSMREIKRVVSSYSLTKIDKPKAEFLTNSIALEMNREDLETITLEISNLGLSDLMWDLDFTFPAPIDLFNSKAKNLANGLKRFEAAELPKTINSRNLSFTDNQKLKAISGDVVYSTSFETNEGFALGTYSGISDWKGSDNVPNLKISNQNPKTGNNHLRLESNTSGSTQFITAPFFGPQIFGEYDISIDFSISGAESESETFDIYLLDSRNRELSSGVIMTEGTIYFYSGTESGGSFLGGSYNNLPEVYKNLRIVYNPALKTISYYIDNELIREGSYANGFSPDEMLILHRNGTTGSIFDIDDIIVKRTGSPFKWLNTSDFGGVVSLGESSTFDLIFSTVDVPTGLYRTVLQVRSNDDGSPIIEVPISLQVSSTVSNESELNTPQTISLDQNFPNPFNPTTNIRYTLSEASDVNLTIYNVQGQKVVTLVNELQASGSQTISFDASRLSSGIYFYTLSTPSATITKQMALIK